MGDRLFKWGTGNWRWTVWVLAAGDPVYCLGRVETRTHDEREEGIDTSIPNSLLVVRGNKDIGMQVHLHRGTELSLNRWLALNYRSGCNTISNAGIQCDSIHLVISLRLRRLLRNLHRPLHHHPMVQRQPLLVLPFQQQQPHTTWQRLHAFPLRSP